MEWGHSVAQPRGAGDHRHLQAKRERKEGKGKGKGKVLQGLLHRVRKAKLPHAARRIGMHKSCPSGASKAAEVWVLPRLVCWEGRGSPQRV